MEAQRLKVARHRQAWLYLALLVFGARIAWAFVEIQVVSHASYVEQAQRQQKRRLVIPPQRGTIFDRNGVALAVNREQYEVFLVPRHIADPDRFIAEFTAIIPYDEAELRVRIAAGGWYVRLVRGVSRETVRRLKAADLDGVGVETYHVRHYPYGALAASLLGQVDVDNAGIEGLELHYDQVLRGTPGYAIHQRDALGREYPNFTLPVEAAVDGQDLHLTLDLGLQEIVEESLHAAMEKTRARSGSIVVLDPRTGEVLALANRAAADAEVTGPARNYAVVDQFEPGSTFKIVTLAGLYDNALAAPTDSLFCENGQWTIGGRTLRDVHPYGYLTVEQVIEESSNICAAKLADRLGADRFYEYARRFGFGLPTGLDFPGEPRGTLRRPEQWSALSSASLAMGYEVMVTSLQMAMAYGAIANGGELLRPYLVRRIEGPAGAVAFEGRPQRVRRVMRPETARQMTQALVRVVEVGTAQSAQIDVLPVAGKTGTSRKTGPGGYEGRYTSSFAGFFPATDARYVAFVRIDEPIGAFYGGAVAAPIFREAMERGLLTDAMLQSPGLMGRLRSPDRVVWTVSDTFGALPPLAAPDTARPADGVAEMPRTAQWDPVLETPSGLDPEAEVPYVIDVRADGGTASPGFDPRSQVKVPDFGGLALREAVHRAARLGLQLVFDGSGRVRGQAPEPGEIVPRGQRVRVHNP